MGRIVLAVTKKRLATPQRRNSATPLRSFTRDKSSIRA
jgi:hypothetical protein